MIQPNIVHQTQFQYELDQVVWAKLRGYPWWPGQIIRIIQDEHQKKYQVYFLIDRTTCEIRKQQLKPYFLQGECPQDQNLMSEQWRKQKKLIDSLLKQEFTALDYLIYSTPISPIINPSFFNHNSTTPFNTNFVSFANYQPQISKPINGLLITNQTQNQYLFKRYFPILRQVCQSKGLTQFHIMQVVNHLFMDIQGHKNRQNQICWFIKGLRSMTKQDIFKCYIQ